MYIKTLFYYTFIVGIASDFCDSFAFVGALWGLCVSEVGDDFLYGCLVFFVDRDLAGKGALSVDADTIVVGLTVAISLQ